MQKKHCTKNTTQISINFSTPKVNSSSLGASREFSQETHTTRHAWRSNEDIEPLETAPWNNSTAGINVQNSALKRSTLRLHIGLRGSSQL